MAVANTLLPHKAKTAALQKLMEREIPPAHVNELRARCGLREGEGMGGQRDLPQAVLDEYWAWKTIRDRVDMSGWVPYEFTLICRLAMQHELREDDVKKATLIELFVAKKIRKDCPVVFRMPIKKGDQEGVSRVWLNGTLRGLAQNGTKIIVIQVGDSQQLVLDEENVRVDPEVLRNLGLPQDDEPLEPVAVGAGDENDNEV